MLNRVLWVVQFLLAALFLFAGVSKFALPEEQLRGPLNFPVLFIQFIGVCEILGALGLILPGLLHIRTYLTPLAAAGLFVIMVGAVVTTVGTMGVTLAILPFIAGALAAFVAYGRWKLAPLG